MCCAWGVGVGGGGGYEMGAVPSVVVMTLRRLSSVAKVWHS